MRSRTAARPPADYLELAKGSIAPLLPPAPEPTLPLTECCVGRVGISTCECIKPQRQPAREQLPYKRYRSGVLDCPSPHVPASFFRSGRICCLVLRHQLADHLTASLGSHSSNKADRLLSLHGMCSCHTTDSFHPLASLSPPWAWVRGTGPSTSAPHGRSTPRKAKTPSVFTDGV